MNVYDLALAALRSERDHIDAAITALRAVASRPEVTTNVIDKALTSAATTLAREAEAPEQPTTIGRDDTAKNPEMKARRTAGPRGVLRTRFAPLYRRLVRGPATRTELAALFTREPGQSDGQVADAFANTLTQARSAGLVGFTGRIWSLTDAGREWHS